MSGECAGLSNRHEPSLRVGPECVAPMGGAMRFQSLGANPNRQGRFALMNESQWNWPQKIFKGGFVSTRQICQDQLI